MIWTILCWDSSICVTPKDLDSTWKTFSLSGLSKSVWSTKTNKQANKNKTLKQTLSQILKCLSWKGTSVLACESLAAPSGPNKLSRRFSDGSHNEIQGDKSQNVLSAYLCDKFELQQKQRYIDSLKCNVISVILGLLLPASIWIQPLGVLYTAQPLCYQHSPCYSCESKNLNFPQAGTASGESPKYIIFTGHEGA